MKYNWKEHNREKHLFKSYYCSSCKQTKPCHILNQEYCCACYYQNEREKAKEYSNYEKVLISKKREQKERFRQLKLLKDYKGCKQCGSKEVDAYFLYENNRLVCQPCQMRKEGSASGAISFSEQSKWYKSLWKVDLREWLENFSQLPVNKNCADKWLKDKEHLSNCTCLEKETRETCSLFTNSLKKDKEVLSRCKCEASNKPRTPYYDSANYGYTYCEKCKVKIKGAGKMGIIKNRNDPKFWGLEIKEKVLCLECLKKYWEKMPVSKRYTLNKYSKRGY